MRRTAIAVVLLILAGLILWRWDWVMALRDNNLSYFTDDLFAQWGYGILFFTIPLMIVQNVVTLFPILILIVFHFIVFGVWGGMLFSLIGTVSGALLCFYLARFVAGKWFQRYWSKNEKKLEKVIQAISKYGVYMIVFLRSIPVMPSNLISVAAAASPIRERSYVYSTIFGNVAMIGVLSFLSAPLWVDEGGIGYTYQFFFLFFFLSFISYFIYHFIKDRKRLIRSYKGE
ncbi:TVP38/TMEM64 family protein [Salisediminibacterium beveridgei]|nr:VTT domain-containing protein [Salisediminibacterium beveridgei]